MGKSKPVIAWWSGGAASAVVCKICIDRYGISNVMVVFIDTHNEDSDTYRFKDDCEKWYGTTIQTISNKDYDNIEEVWERYLSLNVATGAICSAELKRKVRQDFQNKNDFSCQAFGFDKKEKNRADNMLKNYPNSKPFFPLIEEDISKKKSIRIIQEAGIELPITYRHGFENNNCFGTGCVQGGIGYWQKMMREFPEKFNKMADMEHQLTDLKGQPVTMLKDQSKKSKGLVFLKAHPKYPNIKDITMMKGRRPENLMECNGFCGDKNLFS